MLWFSYMLHHFAPDNISDCQHVFIVIWDANKTFQWMFFTKRHNNTLTEHHLDISTVVPYFFRAYIYTRSPKCAKL